MHPNSGRLQKFFGVSHIKIDPQLTDVTIVPQARLTMEQQVSSDVTLTYITNLAVTNQQIVRVQWDFSRKVVGGSAARRKRRFQHRYPVPEALQVAC